MRCDHIHFSGHALRRMFDRGISKDEVIAAVRDSETIVDYPDDIPYPSRLLLGIVKGQPVHVVVARDKKDYSCYVVTAYVPSTKLWHDDFKLRKNR